MSVCNGQYYCQACYVAGSSAYKSFNIMVCVFCLVFLHKCGKCPNLHDGGSVGNAH